MMINHYLKEYHRYQDISQFEESFLMISFFAIIDILKGFLWWYVLVDYTQNVQFLE